MKYLVPATAAAVALCAPLQAAQVQLTLDYDISVFGFAPSDDFSNDDASGFAFPDVGNTFTEYDAARTNTLLQDVFGNSQPFGGATFGGDNNWIQDEAFWDFDSIRATFTIDTDDFVKGNVVGAIPSDDIRFYDFDATIQLLSGGSLNEEISFRGYSTVAADDVQVGGTDEAPIIGDVIAISVDASEAGAPGLATLDFLFGDTTGVKQFQSLPDGGNALEQAFTPGSIGIVEYSEEIVEGDGPAGIYFIQGAVQGFDLISLDDVAVTGGSTEAAPLVPDAPAEGEPASETFGFSVDLATLQEEFEGTPVVWIDPIVAVGYTYTIEDMDGNALPIAGVIAPSLEFVNDPDGYFVEFTAGGTAYKEAIAPGQRILFGDLIGGGTGTVEQFVLSGIDPSLMLDPTNPTLFRTGILPGRGVQGEVRLTQTPITEDYPPAPIPLPLPATMLLAGLGGLLLVRRKKA